MIFLQTSVKVLRSKVNVLIFLGLSQKECVCYVCYVTCVTLCGTHPKMTPSTVRPGWKKLTVWANLTIMTYCFTITNFEDNCQGFAMQQSLSQSNKPFSFYSHRRRALFQDFIYYFTSTKRQSNFNYPRIAIIA